MDLDAWFYREDLMIREMTGLQNLEVRPEPVFMEADRRVFPKGLTADVTGPLARIYGALADFVGHPIRLDRAKAAFDDEALVNKLTIIQDHLLAAGYLMADPEVQALVQHTRMDWTTNGLVFDLGDLEDVPF